MTPAERLQSEKARIMAERGWYVPPYRLANLMKAAGRIMELLTKADIAVRYEECIIVLDIVAAAITSATKEAEHNDDQR